MHRISACRYLQIYLRNLTDEAKEKNNLKKQGHALIRNASKTDRIFVPKVSIF